MTTGEPTRTLETAFINRLRSLADDEDRGALAALRRSLQEPSGIAMAACPYVVPFLPSAPDRWRERTYYLVGGLFALHPEHADNVSLGRAFRRINDKVTSRAGDDNASIRARFVALLDAPADDVGELLRHAVSLCRAREVPLDWAQLLRDLLYWNNPDRSRQRALAGDFWAGDADESSTSPSESEQTK